MMEITSQEAPQVPASRGTRSLVIAAIAVAALIGGWLLANKLGIVGSSIGRSEVPIGEVLAVDPVLLPSGFEANKLPLERNVPVLENYDMLLEDGGVQSARVYVSQKSVDENTLAYKEYFQQNKWNVLLENVTEGASVLSTRSAEYTGSHLNVTIQPVGEDGSLVSVYLVRRPFKSTTN